jgi:chromosome segregation ATPase
MTDHCHTLGNDDAWAEAFARAIRSQRNRLREFLAALAERERRAKAELEAWLEESPSALPALPAQAAPATALDWEAEKRRLLAALEAEGDGSSSETGSHAEALAEIQEVVRRTDMLLAEKDREIAELKQLLQDQSANLGSVAVGAAAIGQLLDADEIVREEREKLRRLQAEWEEKMRTAEIEISTERAKLARQRAELEEMLRENQLGNGPKGNGSGKTEAASSGRWLARLGLKDSKGD